MTVIYSPLAHASSTPLRHRRASDPVGDLRDPDPTLQSTGYDPSIKAEAGTNLIDYVPNLDVKKEGITFNSNFGDCGSWSGFKDQI